MNRLKLGWGDRCEVTSRSNRLCGRCMPTIVDRTYCLHCIDEYHRGCGPIRNSMPPEIVTPIPREIVRWLEFIRPEDVTDGDVALAEKAQPKNNMYNLACGTNRTYILREIDNVTASDVTSIYFADRDQTELRKTLRIRMMCTARTSILYNT